MDGRGSYEKRGKFRASHLFAFCIFKCIQFIQIKPVVKIMATHANGTDVILIDNGFNFGVAL